MKVNTQGSKRVTNAMKRNLHHIVFVLDGNLIRLFSRYVMKVALKILLLPLLNDFFFSSEGYRCEVDSRH